MKINRGKNVKRLRHASKRLSIKNLGIFILVFALIGGFFIWRSIALNPNLPGDINNDNKVNLQDLAILLTNFGTTNSIADLNSDGKVNIQDLAILLTNYGRTAGPPTVSLSANPTQITSGQTATLSWSSTNSTSCSASGSWTGTLGTSGSYITPALTQSSAFNLTCYGSGGSTFASVIVTVAAASGGPGEIAPESACPNQTDTSASASVQEAAMLCMTNYARNYDGGLPPLSNSTILHNAAAAKDNDIVTCNDFSHTACGREFQYWILYYGYTGACYGENIAVGFLTVHDTFVGWMNSPGHRSQILSGSYREAGEATVYWSGHGPLWATDFGGC